jgi:hypothetical protein
MLRSAGIEAYPVLISTRNHGKISYDYPYSHFFNYVIIVAIVDGKKIISDATEVLCLNDRIPSRCINDKGLIIKNEKTEWIGLECFLPSQIITEIDFEISNDDEIIATIKKNSTEYDAFYYRNFLTDDKDKIKKELDSKDFTTETSSLSIENQLEKNKPLIFSYKLIGKSEIVNDKIYLLPFLNEIITDNPLKQKVRTYPIDMTYPVKRIFKSRISIPEGYQVDYLPAKQIINNQLFELNYSVKNDNNEVNIVFDYYFKKSVYSSADYSKIKFYFNKIVNKGNEKIVLSRKILESN